MKVKLLPPLTKPEFIDCAGNQVNSGDYVVFNSNGLSFGRVVQVTWSGQLSYDGNGKYLGSTGGIFLPRIKMATLRRKYVRDSIGNGYSYQYVLGKSMMSIHVANKILRINSDQLNSSHLELINGKFDEYMKKHPHLNV